MYDSVVCFMFIDKCSSVHEMDCLREETVSVPFCIFIYIHDK